MQARRAVYQHTPAMQGLKERCFASTENMWVSLCCDGRVDFLFIALLSPEAAQLCPFASTSWGRYNSRKLLLTPATYYNAEIFLKLRLMRCLSPACPCLDALISTVCLSHYWNGKPELNGSSPFQFTFNWRLGAFFPSLQISFFTLPQS